MKPLKSKRDEWMKMLEHGDYREIEKVSGMKAKQVSRALRTGRMALRTYFILYDYFEGKKRTKF